MSRISDLFNRPKMKAKIIINLDEPNHKADVDVAGNHPSILTAVSLLVCNMLDHGFSKEEIDNAINIGIENKEKISNAKIQVKEIHITKENEEELKKFLEKIMKED